MKQVDVNWSQIIKLVTSGCILAEPNPRADIAVEVTNGTCQIMKLVIEYNGWSSSWHDYKYIDLEPDHKKLVNSRTDMERARSLSWYSRRYMERANPEADSQWKWHGASQRSKLSTSGRDMERAQSISWWQWMTWNLNIQLNQQMRPINQSWWPENVGDEAHLLKSDGMKPAA